MTFFTHFKSGYKINIKLNPNAKRVEIGDIVVGANEEVFLKISLNTVPEKGKANRDLLNFLAEKLHISKQALSIISGLTDHYKKIYLNIPQTTENDAKLALLAKEDKWVLI